MYETILLPYDGSDEARRGAEHGLELAEALGASVHVLYVADLPGVPRTVYVSEDEDDVRERYQTYGEEVTSELCDLASERGIDCTTAIKYGAPAEEIVYYADEEDLDAIVIGSAYRGKFGAILGGTSDKVVRSATVPVVTVRMTIND